MTMTPASLLAHYLYHSTVEYCTVGATPGAATATASLHSDSDSEVQNKSLLRRREYRIAGTYIKALAHLVVKRYGLHDKQIAYLSINNTSLRDY